MFNPEKHDPYEVIAKSSSDLKSACKYILENTKVKPNYETTINYYHQVVLEVLEMMEHMQTSIEYYKWDAAYGEDRED
jgi:hypothetical protein